MNAIMIMAHKDFAHVKRLVDKCVSNDTRVILHFDSKMQVSQEDINALTNGGGVYLSSNRLSGALDDRSLVDIVFEMISTASKVEKEENIHFDYYLLLSGQDYLTKPIWFINQKLQESYPKSYIDCTPYDRNNWIFHKFRGNDGYRKYRDWITKHFPKRNIIRKAIGATSRLYRKMNEILHNSDYDHLKKVDCDIYGGSAWWILSDKIIDFVVSEYINQPKYIQILLKSYTPEETFFQTVAKKSSLGKDIAVNPKEMVAQNCKTWAYFSDDGKPFKGHPYVFTADEYEKLINRDCWIARKFDSEQSADVLNMLDAYLEKFEE